jgi:hypothetical protein
MSYHQYSYSTLGTNCAPQTTAWTSNNKFLIPDSPVYNNNIQPIVETDTSPTDNNHMSMSGCVKK